MSKMVELFKGMMPQLEVIEDGPGQWKAFVIPFPEQIPHYYFRAFGGTAQLALRKAIVKFRRAKRLTGFHAVMADFNVPPITA
ncbi:hypothetical protein [Pseudomonas putida]|uniref:Uncharacterized protein n=1 Tax=Pseudomonas putida TaxID=303 RepID=A0A7V8J480_PSEPU|nr:hypothetical protein [Pseudomonas putida]KAF0254312.1 hypothetical protein GN299_13730 [Pseudomonas putida]